jgi:hypothetical protein
LLKNATAGGGPPRVVVYAPLVRARSALPLLALAFAACGPPPPRPVGQEPIVAIRFLPHGFHNPVAFGASLDNLDDVQEAAVALIDSVVAGRLPGVRFVIVHGDIVLYGHVPSPSWRWEGYQGLIVLGWYHNADHDIAAPGLALPGLDWEVDHLVRGVGDDGRRIRFGLDYALEEKWRQDAPW